MSSPDENDELRFPGEEPATERMDTLKDQAGAAKDRAAGAARDGAAQARKGAERAKKGAVAAKERAKEELKDPRKAAAAGAVGGAAVVAGLGQASDGPGFGDSPELRFPGEQVSQPTADPATPAGPDPAVLGPDPGAPGSLSPEAPSVPAMPEGDPGSVPSVSGDQIETPGASPEIDPGFDPSGVELGPGVAAEVPDPASTEPATEPSEDPGLTTPEGDPVYWDNSGNTYRDERTDDVVGAAGQTDDQERVDYWASSGTYTDPGGNEVDPGGVDPVEAPVEPSGSDSVDMADSADSLDSDVSDMSDE